MDKTSNNLVERMQGAIRERDKVMRGMKTRETAEVLNSVVKLLLFFQIIESLFNNRVF